jgi:ribonuclease BN (tRNA processing enzyme)
LLSHTHWDHIQGLGFFAPVFIGGNQFTVWGPGDSPKTLEDILEGQMDPNFSPLQTLRNFSATFDVKAATDAFEVMGLQVRAKEHPHGATTSLAFRLEENGKSFVYASDVGYVSGMDGLESLFVGADVLLHDTTYRPADQETRRDRGFSSYEQACDAAIACGVKRLVTFHYDQDYTDDDVDQIVAACEARLAPHGIAVTPAREGDELTVE